MQPLNLNCTDSPGRGTIVGLAALAGLVRRRGRAPERGTIVGLAVLGGLVGVRGGLAREEREKKQQLN